MTDTDIRRRAVELMNESNTLHYDQALEQAGVELAAQAEAEAEGRRRATEFSDSFIAMTTCAVPGCTGGKDRITGLCEAHTRVWYMVQAEATAAEKLPDGRTVRDWVAALVEERAGR